MNSNPFYYCIVIKEILKKHNFVESDLDIYTNSTYILGVDTFASNITIDTTAMWSAPNEFRVNLNTTGNINTAVGTNAVSQLILDNEGTLNISNRVQHVGSVFYEIETRELKVYNGTEWVTIQQL